MQSLSEHFNKMQLRNELFIDPGSNCMQSEAHSGSFKSNLRNSASSNLKSDARASLLSVKTIDSGIGSFIESNLEWPTSPIQRIKSRWENFDTKSFHGDFKKFLRKFTRDSTTKVVRPHHFNPRSSQYSNIFRECCKDEDMDESQKSSLMEIFKLDVGSSDELLKTSLVSLCSAISNFMRQRYHLEQEVFQLNGNSRYFFDLKQLIHFDCTSSMVADKIPRVLSVLFKNMNLSSVETLFKEVEAFCPNINLESEDSSSAIVELRQSIESLRCSFITYITCGSPDNFKMMIDSMQSLSDNINSLSTRLWVLKGTVGV